MVRSLRRYHFNIWRVFALILPVAFIMALVLRPVTTRQSYGRNQFSFSMRKSVDHVTINIRLVNSLQSPSCLVYALPKSGEKQFLGTIERPGDYTFDYTGKIIGVQLFDLIHQKEIHTEYFDHEELP